MIMKIICRYFCVFIDFPIQSELTGSLECRISHPIYANSWWQVKMGSNIHIQNTHSFCLKNLPFFTFSSWLFKNRSQKPVAALMQILVEVKRGVHIQIISKCVPKLGLDYPNNWDRHVMIFVQIILKFSIICSAIALPNLD